MEFNWQDTKEIDNSSCLLRINYVGGNKNGRQSCLYYQPFVFLFLSYLYHLFKNKWLSVRRENDIKAHQGIWVINKWLRLTYYSSLPTMVQDPFLWFLRILKSVLYSFGTCHLVSFTGLNLSNISSEAVWGCLRIIASVGTKDLWNETNSRVQEGTNTQTKKTKTKTGGSRTYCRPTTHSEAFCENDQQTASPWQAESATLFLTLLLI